MLAAAIFAGTLSAFVENMGHALVTGWLLSKKI
jgi:hypothetical protein